MAISIIIPVFHEETRINEAINRLKNMPREETVEIIVVDGSAKGETIKSIRNGSASAPVIALISGKGRGKQMNEGALAARGDILLFLHVDTELPRDAFERICLAMKEGNFVGGAFNLGIGGRGLAFRIIEQAASLRSRLTRIPYGDQAIFFRHDYFLRIGGYKELPIMEDVEIMGRVKRQGGRICFIDEKVKTSARRWEKEGIAACTLRNRTIMLLYLLGVSPERLAKWYP